MLLTNNEVNLQTHGIALTWWFFAGNPDTCEGLRNVGVTYVDVISVRRQPELRQPMTVCILVRNCIVTLRRGMRKNFLGSVGSRITI